MKYVWYLSGIASLVGAVATMITAKGAVHEIEALMFLLIGVVCLMSGGIIAAIQSLRTIE